MRSINCTALMFTLALVACENQGTTTNVSATSSVARSGTPPQPGAMPNSAAPMASGADQKPAMSGSAAPEATNPPAGAPTDEQILKILEASNDKEIEESKAAQDKLVDKDAKAFAKMMVEHHTDAKKKQEALIEKIKLKPADAPDATKLVDATKTEVEKLKKLSGGDLDKAYVELMLNDHKATLDDLDKKIIPAIKNAELKAAVEKEVRPMVEGHLKQIEGHAKRLGVGAAK
jgi:putative membrane protein